MSPSIESAQSPVATASSLAAAEVVYERLRPRMDALAEEDLAPLNVDILVASSIAYAAAPRIAALRAEIVGTIPSFDTDHIDNLVDYAQSTWFVHVTRAPAAAGTDADAIVEEAVELRGKLLLWATPLAAEGRIDAAAVERIRAGTGHKDTASDLVALVALFRTRWDDVKQLCGVRETELDRGAQLATTLWGIASQRENEIALPSRAESGLRVRRAFTLLDRAYSECRRAVQFLRFHAGDADLIAPTLRRNAGGGARARSRSIAEEPAPIPAPAAPPPASTGLGGAGSPFITPATEP